MFARRYFAARYFAPRYFPPVAAAAEDAAVAAYDYKVPSAKKRKRKRVFVGNQAFWSDQTQEIARAIAVIRTERTEAKKKERPAQTVAPVSEIVVEPDKPSIVQDVGWALSLAQDEADWNRRQELVRQFLQDEEDAEILLLMSII